MKRIVSIALLALALVLTACKSTTVHTPTPPTATPEATEAPDVSIDPATPTPGPTHTPQVTQAPSEQPTATPAVTQTPAPTAKPTATAKPTTKPTTAPTAKPTATKAPTATPAPTAAATPTAAPATSAPAPTAEPGDEKPVAPTPKGKYILNGKTSAQRPAVLSGQTLLPISETTLAFGASIKPSVIPHADGSMDMTLSLEKDGKVFAVLTYTAYEHSSVLYAKNAAVTHNGKAISVSTLALVDGSAFLSLDFFKTVFGMTVTVDGSNNVTASM